MTDTIQLMKQQVLVMAIRGELVKQYLDEGTTEKELEYIKDVKKELISEMKIRKRKNNLKISEDEKSIKIHETWKWVKLGSITYISGGKRVPKGMSLIDEPTDHAYLRVTDMQNNTIVSDSLKYLTDEVYDKIKKYKITKDELYLTIAGTIGRVGLIPEEFDGMNLTENACKIYPYKSDLKYLMYTLSSGFVQKQFEEGYNQLAQPKLSIRTAEKTLIPLPPLLEQKRIVSKIEEIFSIIDKIAERKEDALQTIQLIRQTTLQQAIQGKLVEQNEQDEPASKLIDRIEEKENLFNSVNEESASEVREIIINNRPYEIPETWTWVKIEDIGQTKGGNGFPKKMQTKFSGKYPVFKVGDLSRVEGKYAIDSEFYLDKEDLNLKTFYIFPKCTVVFPKIGAALLLNNRKILYQP